MLPSFENKNQSLVDPAGRWLHKLRVQLTDACNFRCFYCMPEDPTFLKHSELLSVEELSSIIKNLHFFGVDEIRLTGGEPTFRKDFIEIANMVSEIPFNKIGLTTNGYKLNKIINELKNTKLTSINISLDSLNEEKFNKISKGNFFKTVLNNILLARDSGFKVKINCILFKNLNTDELFQFLEFSEKEKIEVRFLEYMKIGVGAVHNTQDSFFFSADEAIEALSEKTLLIPESSSWDSTSFGFKTLKGGKVGFIASESKPFCSTCSRLRLTALGTLRACLMSQNGLSLKGISREDYPQILKSVAALKPITRIEEIHQPMNQIGG
jgi:GTP 3',8-cyclase